jgi:regulator of sigma E protease
VEAVAPAPISIVYTQDGTAESVAEITPVVGLDSEDPDRFLIGVRPALLDTVQLGPLEAVGAATAQTYAMTGLVVEGLGTLLYDSARGEADFSQVAGPVGIVGQVDQAADRGFITLLIFTAFISLNLAVINLLPFPALDGGRLVFVAYEAVTGSQIPAGVAGTLNLVGFGLLMLLLVLVTYNDILRIIS